MPNQIIQLSQESMKKPLQTQIVPQSQCMTDMYEKFSDQIVSLKEEIGSLTNKIKQLEEGESQIELKTLKQQSTFQNSKTLLTYFTKGTEFIKVVPDLQLHKSQSHQPHHSKIEDQEFEKFDDDKQQETQEKMKKSQSFQESSIINKKSQKMNGSQIVSKASTLFSEELFYANEILQDDVPDLIYLYSNPLVDLKFNIELQKEIIQATSFQALQTDIEYNKLIKIIKSTGKGFKIQKQSINFESLKEMVARKPKIIHISCHGDYDENLMEFYLQFEDNIKIGLGDQFHQSRLLELLGTEKDHGIKLAFVSACHSQEIGNILHMCNIPLVIAVNSWSQILDDICLIFSRHLYMQLLQGATILKAFQEAQRTCRASSIDCFSCCCAHSHQPSCVWMKYAIKNGFDKAHQLHSEKCYCNLPNNMHRKSCSVYINFQNFLITYQDKDEIKTEVVNDDPWKFDDDFDFDNFEKNIVIKDIAVKDNPNEIVMICCCHKDVPHDESQKFQLKTDPKNNDMVLFKNQKRGEVQQLHEKRFQHKISQDYDDQWLIGRNIEVQECVKMLTLQNLPRIIKIYGASGCGKVLIAKKAIKYCMDRNFLQDGAFEIDAESVYNVYGFLNKLFQIMRINITHIDDLLDTLQNQQIVLLIHNMQNIFKNDVQELYSLIKRIHEKTLDLKIIFVVKNHNDLDFENCMDTKYIRCSNIQINPLDHSDTVQFLKSFDKNNEVLGKINKETLINHPIFEKKLTNVQILNIIMLLKSEVPLDQINQIYDDEIKYQMKLEQKVYAISDKNISIQMILYQYMDQQYEIERNLLHFMCQAPNGLLMKDIQDLINQKNSRYGNWEAFLEDTIYQPENHYKKTEEQTMASQTDISQIHVKNTHGFKVIFQRQDKEIDEQVYYVKKNVRFFVNKQVLKTNRHYTFLKFLKYFSKLGRQYIRSFRNENNQDFDINSYSADIDSGLWDVPMYNLSQHWKKINEDIENLEVDEILARFNHNEPNFMEAFDFDNVTSILENHIKKIQCVTIFLDELYTCFISLLLIFNRQNDAMTAIDMAIRICSHFEMEITIAKLKLIKISIEIKNKSILDMQRKLNEVENQFKICINKLGQAETLLLQSIWLMAQLQMKKQVFDQKQTLQHLKTQDIQLNNHQISEKLNPIYGSSSTIIMNKNTFFQREYFSSSNAQSQDLNELLKTIDKQLSQKEEHQIMDLKIQIHQLLDRAQLIFSQFSERLCEARVILIRVNFIYQICGVKDGNFVRYLNHLLHSEKIFVENMCLQHRTRSLIYISIIYLEQQDIQKSKKFIQIALSQAREIQDQEQIKFAINILNQIQLKIQMTSNNLLIILSSYPIVEINKETQELKGIYIQNQISIMSERNAAKIIMQQQGKQINIKQEIQNMSQLEQLRDYGCRVLVLNQTVFDQNNNLVIEKVDGESVSISNDQLYQILKPQEGQLNIDLVFLNFKNGLKIAQVFKLLGVSQIFTFNYEDSMEMMYPDSISTSEIPNFYDFMSMIQYKILTKLINQQSFYKAHATTMNEINSKYPPSYINSISWIQGQQDQSGFKLFDESRAVINQKYRIEDGQIEDQTISLPTSNIKMNQGPYIGHPEDLHLIFKSIFEQDQYQIFKITGIQGVGKSRFVNEVGTRLLIRQVFQDGVYLLDFKSIISQHQINALFKNLGIEFLLQNTKIGNSSKGKEKEEKSGPLARKQLESLDQEEKSILLIYDNTEIIENNVTLFNQHIRQILKFSSKIKMIMVHQHHPNDPQEIPSTHKGPIQNKEITKEIELKPLRDHESVELVMLYCIRELKEEEFQITKSFKIHTPLLLNRQKTVSYKKSHLIEDTPVNTKGVNNQIRRLLQQNLNFKQCQNNPEGLMILALILRSTQMNKIFVTQFRAQKKLCCNIDQLIKQELHEDEDEEKPATFHEQLASFKDRQSKKESVRIIQKKMQFAILNQFSKKFLNLGLPGLASNNQYNKILKRIQSTSDAESNESSISSIPGSYQKTLKKAETIVVQVDEVDEFESSMQSSSSHSKSQTGNSIDNDSECFQRLNSDDQETSKDGQSIQSFKSKFIQKPSNEAKRQSTMTLNSQKMLSISPGQDIPGTKSSNNSLLKIFDFDRSMTIQSTNTAVNSEIFIYNEKSDIKVYAICENNARIEIFKMQEYQKILQLQNLQYAELLDYSKDIDKIQNVIEIKEIIPKIFLEKSNRITKVRKVKQNNGIIKFIDCNGCQLCIFNEIIESSSSSKLDRQNTANLVTNQIDKSFHAHDYDHSTSEEVEPIFIEIIIPVQRVNRDLKKQALIQRNHVKGLYSKNFCSMRKTILEKCRHNNGKDQIDEEHGCSSSKKSSPSSIKTSSLNEISQEAESTYEKNKTQNT